MWGVDQLVRNCEFHGSVGSILKILSPEELALLLCALMRHPLYKDHPPGAFGQHEISELGRCTGPISPLGAVWLIQYVGTEDIPALAEARLHQIPACLEGIERDTGPIPQTIVRPAVGFEPMQI
jgi:hypothetical protein